MDDEPSRAIDQHAPGAALQDASGAPPGDDVARSPDDATPRKDDRNDHGEVGDEDVNELDDRSESFDDDLDDRSGDDIAGRHNALPRRVESWRSRSATGAIATAMAMGLQQVFEPERRRPAAVAEAPSDPYDENDPVTVDYVPDDAEGTRVHVKPWLLERQDPA